MAEDKESRTEPATARRRSETRGLVRHLATLLAGPVIPLILAVVVAALFAGVGQVGFLVTAEPMKPDLNKISPVRGAGRLFSLRSVVTLPIEGRGIVSVGK